MTAAQLCLISSIFNKNSKNIYCEKRKEKEKEKLLFFSFYFLSDFSRSTYVFSSTSHIFYYYMLIAVILSLMRFLMFCGFLNKALRSYGVHIVHYLSRPRVRCLGKLELVLRDRGLNPM